MASFLVGLVTILALCSGIAPGVEGNIRIAQPQLMFTLAEDSRIGYPVGEMSDAVVVREGSRNLTYTSSDPSFSSDASGLLRTAVALDYETKTIYELSVGVGQGGAAPTVSIIVFVSVTDVNEPPAFATASASVVASGDDISVFTPDSILATDPDSGDNGYLEYSFIAGNDDKYFSINKDTGLITQVSTIDRSIMTSTNLVIQAVDGGTDPLVATYVLRVTVEFAETTTQSPTTTTPATISCPGWMTAFGNKCYKLIKGRKNYAKAEANCVWLAGRAGLSNGHLATVADLATQNFITGTLMVPRMSVWIGLNDKAVDGTFVWEDGTAFSYSNWATQDGVQQPAGSTSQNCVIIGGRAPRKDFWNDYSCNMKSWSVCQFEA